MKKVITKPALTTKINENNFNSYKKATTTQPLFKKHNFFVETLDGKFKAFSYEGNYDGIYVSVSIFDATSGEVVLNAHPPINLIARKAAAGYDVLSIDYETFCSALFKYVCEYISSSEDLVGE